MLSRWALLAAAIVVSSCSSNRHEPPPTTVVDACRMQTERPHWFAAMRATESKWGVPVHVQLATIARESSFVANARPTRRERRFFFFTREVPRSSAYGYSQAIDGTWEWYVRETGHRRADRTRFADASDFIGWYMTTTQRRNGVPLHDAYNQYLAYHEGHGGFSRRTYQNKTWLPPVARDVQNWANRYESQLRLCPSRA
jgi:hypothetical protein